MEFQSMAKGLYGGSCGIQYSVVVKGSDMALSSVLIPSIYPFITNPAKIAKFFLCIPLQYLNPSINRDN